MLVQLNQIILTNLLVKIEEYSDVIFDKVEIQKSSRLGSALEIEINQKLEDHLTANEYVLLHSFCKNFLLEMHLWEEIDPLLFEKNKDDVFYFCKKFFDWFEEPNNRLKFLYFINKKKIQF